MSATLEATARRCGAYRWIEHRCFELTGAWAAASHLDQVTVFLDALSAEHAWHAQLWTERLPVLAGADPDALTAVPSQAVAELFAALAEPTSGSGAEGGARADGLGHLGALARVVLPRLSVTYSAHLASGVAVTDGAVLRALRLAGRDVTEAWAAAESLLQGLMATADEGSAVAERVAHLEGRLLAGGAGQGL